MVEMTHFNSRRDAITLFEVTVVAGILTLLAATFAQVLVSLSTAEKSLQQTAAAQRAIDNLAEKYQAISEAALIELQTAWESTSPQELALRELPNDVCQRLPGARLGMAVEAENDPAGVYRISIDLSWQRRGGQYGRPVRLVVWNYSATK